MADRKNKKKAFHYISDRFFSCVTINRLNLLRKVDKAPGVFATNRINLWQSDNLAVSQT